MDAYLMWGELPAMIAEKVAQMRRLLFGRLYGVAVATAGAVACTRTT
ncbi:hypothetical protein [Streptosporangium canum]